MSRIPTPLDRVRDRYMTRAVPTLTVLRAARKLVANPETWTRASMTRSADGTCVSADSPKACRWCAIGAIVVAAERSGLDSSFFGLHSLWTSLGVLAKRRGFADLARANDHYWRKAALAVLNDAMHEIENAGARR